MASDVEVLRGLAEHYRVAAGGAPTDYERRFGRERWLALSSAISALEAREAQPKVEGRMDDVSMVTTIRLLADVRLNLAYGHSPEEAESDEHKAVRLIEDECVRARASEAALKEEARHWEAKWLQEKMNGKKALEETRQEMARQAGVIEIQRRTEEVAKNDALRDLYEAQEKLETAQKRIEELDSLVELARLAVAADRARINHARAPQAVVTLANALREAGYE